MQQPPRPWRITPILILTLTFCGCLVPTDIDGPPNSFPPRIVLNELQPNPLDTPAIDVGVQCNSFFFSIGSIEDPDVHDTLRVRWFLDYAVGGPTENPINFPETLVSPSGNPLRLVGDRIDIQPNARFRNRGQATHSVDVVVTDGPFNDDPEDPLPNRTPAEGVNIAVWRWTLNTPDPIDDPIAGCPEQEDLP